MKNNIKKCPECGSDKITRFNTYNAVVGVNVKTGKVIYRDKNYDKGDITLYSYRCRACGWNSDPVVM
jgi:predicted RNA-binding Zn-ribbon protein involved in translation (DUF1610 family)